MLTGEYFILDGAKAFAIPTTPGQSMAVKQVKGSEIGWKSLDVHGTPWFEGSFSLFDFSFVKASDAHLAQKITNLLNACINQNPEFLSKWNGQRVETRLEFNKDWGLGSSSTLIKCLAEWADVNPFQLLFDTSGGSGYDVACAVAGCPIIYQSSDDSISFSPCDFEPGFADNLYFVYLGKKQNSETAVEKFRQLGRVSPQQIDDISQITDEFIEATSLGDLDKLINQHEKIISYHLKEPMVKTKLFPDFWGSVKSLGAWGGDFVLVTSDQDKEATKQYFSNKGLPTFLSYRELAYVEEYA